MKRKNDNNVIESHSCKYKRQLLEYIKLVREFDSREYGVFCAGKDCDCVTIATDTCGVIDEWVFCDECGEYYCEDCAEDFENVKCSSVKTCLNCKPEQGSHHESHDGGIVPSDD